MLVRSGMAGSKMYRTGSETVPPFRLDQVEQSAADLESRGYDIVSASETGHDPFMQLTVAARATTRARLMTSVAIAFPRAPYITANMAWDLAQYSGGRFILGLGTQVRGHNERRFSVPWVPPGPRLRDYILCIRAIWDTWQNGTPPAFESEHYQFTLTNPAFQPEPIDFPDIKIVNGALNPYNARLGGEVGDGVIFHALCSFEYTREVLLPAVLEGARRAGREPGELIIGGFGYLVTGRNDEEVALALERQRRSTAFHASTSAYHSVMRHHGWEEEAMQLRRLSIDGKWDEIADVITDEMLDALCVVGTWDEIAAKMREKYSGLCTIVGFSAQPENEDEAEQIREIIGELRTIPALGEV